MKVDAVGPYNWGVHAFEPNDCVTLSLRPEVTVEATLTRFRQRTNLENDTVHVAKIFLAKIMKFIVPPVESSWIDIDHLKKSFRHIRRGGHPIQVRDWAYSIVLFLPLVNHGVIHDTLGEISLSQKVVIVYRNSPGLGI